MYPPTKNGVSRSSLSKARAQTGQTDRQYRQTDRQTDRQTQTQTDMTEHILQPHSPVVNK